MLVACTGIVNREEASFMIFKFSDFSKSIIRALPELTFLPKKAFRKHLPLHVDLNILQFKRNIFEAT